MTGDDLPNEHHVVRYVNFISIRPLERKTGWFCIFLARR